MSATIFSRTPDGNIKPELRPSPTEAEDHLSSLLEYHKTRDRKVTEKIIENTPHYFISNKNNQLLLDLWIDY